MFACFPARLPAWLPPCLPACSNKLLRGFKVAEDDISEPESEVRLPVSHACPLIYCKKTPLSARERCEYSCSELPYSAFVCSRLPLQSDGAAGGEGDDADEATASDGEGGGGRRGRGARKRRHSGSAPAALDFPAHVLPAGFRQVWRCRAGRQARLAAG